MPKPVLPAKRRRKGFESVRKGYRSADARLMFFEKEKVYCKLTVASDIQKGLLLVSFGAVERTLSTILCKRIMKHNHISQPRPHRISSFPRIRLQFG